MTAKTAEEMEQPAKIYHIDAVMRQLDLVDKKVDQILDGQKDYVIHAQLEEAEKRMREYVDTKYGPIYKLFWAVLTALIVASALIMLQLQKG